jgi:glycosyltransferase involved in cell wall biosynthesis
LAESKRILVLTRRRENASFRQRVGAFLPTLAERGIDAEVVELASRPMARLKQFRHAATFDALWLHRKTLTAWGKMALRGYGKPIIYDVDDAVMFQARTADRGPNPTRMRRFRRTVARADLVLAGNPYLARYVVQCGGAVEVVPTGLDASRYTPKTDHGSGGPLRLVWIGSRSTLKRVEPFVDMLSELGRRVKNLQLRIIADAGLDVPGLEVENMPWTRADEARLLSECDIGIAPLPDTPYTRGKCAFKVLQYMAAGLPVVTSPVGANAEYVADGETGYHAIDTVGWIETVQRLASDVSLRRSMGLAGRRRVESEFDISVLGPRVAELIWRALAD